MKKLLLLSALLIFACSSDDSNDNSNQTFFEKYDGVVWELDNELSDVTQWGEDFIGRVQFINEDIIYEKWYEYDIFNNQVYTYCETYPLLYMNENNGSYSEFVEISSDYFTIRISEEEMVNGVTVVRTWTETYTATNNGNNLIKEFGQITDNIGTEYSLDEPIYLFRTTLTDPCE